MRLTFLKRGVQVHFNNYVDVEIYIGTQLVGIGTKNSSSSAEVTNLLHYIKQPSNSLFLCFVISIFVTLR